MLFVKGKWSLRCLLVRDLFISPLSLSATCYIRSFSFYLSISKANSIYRIRWKFAKKWKNLRYRNLAEGYRMSDSEDFNWSLSSEDEFWCSTHFRTRLDKKLMLERYKCNMCIVRASWVLLVAWQKTSDISCEANAFMRNSSLSPTSSTCIGIVLVT